MFSDLFRKSEFHHVTHFPRYLKPWENPPLYLAISDIHSFSRYHYHLYFCSSYIYSLPASPFLCNVPQILIPAENCTETQKKRKKNKNKKQGNKHFPPHSSCSYVMCPEYCDCFKPVFYLSLHSDFVLVVTESIFTFRCESEEEAGSWRDVGDRGDNFFHPTKSSLFNPCQCTIG